MTPLWSVPVVVAAFLTWFSAQPQTIGDAAWREALRRQMVGKSVRLYTNQDLPSGFAAAAIPPTRAAAPANPDDDEAGKTSTPQRTEQWWRDRMSVARASLERDELLAEAVQARINSLSTTLVSKSDPFQQEPLRLQLQKAVVELDRLEKAVIADRQSIDAIQNEARRAGVPPGWLR
jgi:hypothetical protein